MAIIFTRELAERMAQRMERDGYHVDRVYLVTSESRIVNGLTVRSAPYARVWNGNHLYLTIRYEWIDRESLPL